MNCRKAKINKNKVIITHLSKLLATEDLEGFCDPAPSNLMQHLASLLSPILQTQRTACSPLC